MVIGICDDNKLHQNYILGLVNKVFHDNNNIIINPLTPDDLFDMVSDLSFFMDVLITDIDMGNLNGIQLAAKINQIAPNCIIIFVSNYIKFATEVYDVNHVYFVLKSEADKRLPKALEKAYNVYLKANSGFLCFNYQNTKYRIAFSDILCIESTGRYLCVTTAIATYKYIDSLKNVKNTSPDFHVQCHKSFLVNLNHIKEVNRTNCILTNNINIPVSYTYYKTFSDSYLKFISNKMSDI